MARILVALPDFDFDVTEVAVPWKLLSRAGHVVDFVTESGAAPPRADPLLLSGVVLGQLGAEAEPRRFYGEMEADASFRSPGGWRDVVPEAWDALYLPGGHAQGMRPYLESPVLQEKVAAFWALGRPVAAICHGVLVLARTRAKETGRSLLWGRRTTCLPKYMERAAYLATAWKVGRYFRTYDTYVEDEVRAALADAAHFERGPLHLFTRGSDADDRAAFVVEDGSYLSGRWPGDAYLIARRLMARLPATAPTPATDEGAPADDAAAAG